MRVFQSLLLKRIDARLPGLSIMRLRLHRHLAKVDAVKPHRHAFGQLLCYLSPGGTLVLGSVRQEIVAGTLAWIPAGRTHSFVEHPFRRPVCLAIDLHLKSPPPATIVTLAHSEASRIRNGISALGRLPDPASIESRFMTASHTLAILDVEFRGLGFLPRAESPMPSIIGKFHDIASKPAAFHEKIEAICRRLGRNPDHLNRLHRKFTGLTLRQQRDAFRLDACKAALLEGGPVSAAAGRCGFDDMNYFSRWFRRHTGVSPSAFAASGSKKAVKK